MDLKLIDMSFSIALEAFNALLESCNCSFSIKGVNPNDLLSL
jgi:hypothetical protein